MLHDASFSHLPSRALTFIFLLSSPCYRIEQLNVSWCQFTNNHVKSVVNHVSATVTHLNLSGYRDGLTLDGEILTAFNDDCIPYFFYIKRQVLFEEKAAYYSSVDVASNNFALSLFLDVKVLVTRCPDIQTLDLRYVFVCIEWFVTQSCLLDKNEKGLVVYFHQAAAAPQKIVFNSCRKSWSAVRSRLPSEAAVEYSRRILFVLPAS